MWTCAKCGRIFEKKDKIHSCRKIELKEHFKNKKSAEELFKVLVNNINESIGSTKIISLPCCIHLFGKYDFLAALPKKDRLEIRFSLSRVLDSIRLKQSVPVSSKYFKNCIDLFSVEEIDGELLEWIKESYYLKDKN